MAKCALCDLTHRHVTRCEQSNWLEVTWYALIDDSSRYNVYKLYTYSGCTHFKWIVLPKVWSIDMILLIFSPPNFSHQNNGSSYLPCLLLPCYHLQNVATLLCQRFCDSCFNNTFVPLHLFYTKIKVPSLSLSSSPPMHTLLYSLLILTHRWGYAFILYFI